MAESKPPLGEFELINQLFAPLSAGEAGAFSLTDDAAVLAVPAGREMVLTKDVMVAGTHFLPDDPPDLVARKLLRVNLSDLAAMGAEPRGYLVGLALPREVDDDWLRAYAAGLAEDQKIFKINLLGGDTVSTPGPLTLSLTAVGAVPEGGALRRNGARPGDLICISGTIGDGALGLMAIRGEVPDPEGFLARRYRLPEPRCALGVKLRGIATACLDISDGLAADLGHMCTESGISVRICAQKVPLSAQTARVSGENPGLLESILTGGDDYELVFSVPESARAQLDGIAAETGVPITVIGAAADPAAGAVASKAGEGLADGGVTFTDAADRPITFARSGFRHR